jgi:hypothetical protein
MSTPCQGMQPITLAGAKSPSLKEGDLRRNADLSLEIKGNVETILETDVLKLRSCIQTSLKIYLHSYRHNLSLKIQREPSSVQFNPSRQLHPSFVQL